jgi:hypothetical protein
LPCTGRISHGLYYVDLTASPGTQAAFGKLLNVFKGGQTYDFFYVFATPQTEQTYEMFVGTGLTKVPDVKPIRVNIKTAPLVITADTTKSPLPAPPTYSSKGILTVKPFHGSQRPKPLIQLRLFLLRELPGGIRAPGKNIQCNGCCHSILLA